MLFYFLIKSDKINKQNKVHLDETVKRENRITGMLGSGKVWQI